MRTFVLCLVTLAALTVAAGAARTHEPQTAGAEGRGMSQEKAEDGRLMVPGTHMKAFLAAHRSFATDPEIPAGKRDIENYTFAFNDGGDHYSITFVPKRAPGEPVRLGGSTDLGKAVTYKVSKSDYRIIQKRFYR